jgi:hypothetical protein
VLVRLGGTPLQTPPLPTGVRLELVATAPAHRPKRMIVPVAGDWRPDPSGRPTLSVDVELEPGLLTSWPGAPAGRAGGVGPAGVIDVAATPPGTEIWLVATVGEGTRATIEVDCDALLHLLVVNPSVPAQQRRLTVKPSLLQAAAKTGGHELSVFP